MMLTRVLAVVFIAILSMTAAAHAQSPREQLNALAQQLQQVPTDRALRERIIKLSSELKPAPAIPEAAREPFVMGVTILKQATDAAGARKAVDLFTQALNLAPWFADAYYNRAMARETAGQYDSAIDDLKLYLGFTLTDAERREALDKTYAIKARAELASVKKAEEQKVAAAKAAADTPQAREAAFLKKMEGARFRSNLAGPGGLNWDNIYEVKNGELHYTLRINSLGSQNAFYGHSQPGSYLIDRMPYRDGVFNWTEPYVHDAITFRISPDGLSLIKRRGGADERIARQ